MIPKRKYVMWTCNDCKTQVLLPILFQTHKKLNDCYEDIRCVKCQGKTKEGYYDYENLGLFEVKFKEGVDIW